MRTIAGCLLVLLIASIAASQDMKPAHYIAAIEEGKFHGWPANNGVWNWGNEILVGFTQGEFENSPGHNIKGIERSLFARSKDGGESWTAFDPENFLDDENIKWQPKGKTFLETPLDFTHAGFAMRIFATGYHGNDDPEGGFYYSYDRGATWRGPHVLGNLNSHPELAGKVLTPRTDYIVTGPQECFLFITADISLAGQDAGTKTSGRIACIKTKDGALNFEFVTWITPASPEYRAVMPQTVRLNNGDYLMAFRKIYLIKHDVESAIEVWASKDECKTWRHRGIVRTFEDNSNPPAIVELEDGRICCVYGDRDAQRVAGKYSNDQGETWGTEFVIRDHYQSVDDWADMGYPRIIQRPDGKLAVIYYWASEQHPQQHIACSIWQP